MLVSSAVQSIQLGFQKKSSKQNSTQNLNKDVSRRRHFRVTHELWLIFQRERIRWKEEKEKKETEENAEIFFMDEFYDTNENDLLKKGIFLLFRSYYDDEDKENFSHGEWKLKITENASQSEVIFKEYRGDSAEQKLKEIFPSENNALEKCNRFQFVIDTKRIFLKDCWIDFASWKFKGKISLFVVGTAKDNFDEGNLFGNVQYVPSKTMMFLFKCASDHLQKKMGLEAVILVQNQLKLNDLEVNDLVLNPENYGNFKTVIDLEKFYKPHFD